MSDRNRAWVVELVATITQDKPTAEMVVDRLIEEGVLHLGYGNADIDRVVSNFTETFGTTKTSRSDRWAANRLVSKYGVESVVVITKMLAENSQEKYAPVVGSITQLESKWISVLRFLRNLKDDEEIAV